MIEENPDRENVSSDLLAAIKRKQQADELKRIRERRNEEVLFKAKTSRELWNVIVANHGSHETVKLQAMFEKRAQIEEIIEGIRSADTPPSEDLVQEQCEAALKIAFKMVPACAIHEKDTTEIRRGKLGFLEELQGLQATALHLLEIFSPGRASGPKKLTAIMDKYSRYIRPVDREYLFKMVYKKDSKVVQVDFRAKPRSKDGS